MLAQDRAIFSQKFWLEWFRKGVWWVVSALWAILKHWPNNYCGLLSLCAVAAALECSNSCPPREAFLKMGKSVEKGVDRKTHILRVAYLPYHAVEAFPAFLDPTYSSSLLGAMSISIMNVSERCKSTKNVYLTSAIRSESTRAVPWGDFFQFDSNILGWR